MELDAERLESYLPAMMPPLTREYIDSSQSAGKISSNQFNIILLYLK